MKSNNSRKKIYRQLLLSSKITYNGFYQTIANHRQQKQLDCMVLMFKRELIQRSAVVWCGVHPRYNWYVCAECTRSFAQNKACVVCIEPKTIWLSGLDACKYVLQAWNQPTKTKTKQKVAHHSLFIPEHFFSSEISLREKCCSFMDFLRGILLTSLIFYINENVDHIQQKWR